MIGDPLGEAEARAAAIERYEQSNWFVSDAWEAVADAQPAHLTPAVLEWFRGTSDYETLSQEGDI